MIANKVAHANPFFWVSNMLIHEGVRNNKLLILVWLGNGDCIKNCKWLCVGLNVFLVKKDLGNWHTHRFVTCQSSTEFIIVNIIDIGVTYVWVIFLNQFTQTSDIQMTVYIDRVPSL